ncbi:hypothetical protein UPYG_G00064140 [Umbra pygmaea]|uniref:Ig-like domain-containing protein n=1 Tax=Umbra pygmaea TaxID=75934 RepID=A0ABD0XPV8_UMBPY
MLVYRYNLSLWILAVLTRYLQLWDVACSESIPPAPLLTLTSSVETAVQCKLVMVCRAPEGHGGTLFRLNRVKELVANVTFQTERQQAHFTLQMKDPSAQNDLYCCLYQNGQGKYSHYSPYLNLDRQVSPQFPPSPLLSVEPPSGQVRHGQMLSFHCTSPPSQHNLKPEAFLLLRTAKSTGGSMVHAQASLVSRSSAPTGAFSLGPVREAEGGSYTCLYQVTVAQQGLVNSTVSCPVLITVTEVLPAPTLSLDNQKGEWVLTCSGSPSYPGARFYLYRSGSANPEATRVAPLTRHRALFALSSLPPQESGVLEGYQCQYSVLLGTEWSHSERTQTLNVPGVTEQIPFSSSSSTEQTGFDWPLVLGVLSALVLFLTAVAIMGVTMWRKVKAVLQEKRKREVSQLWAKRQQSDHVVDLTLKRISITSQDWGMEERTEEMSRRSHSTFGRTPFY